MADRMVEAIRGQKRMPGSCLGEQALSVLLDCSRIRVHEARMQWAVRDCTAWTTLIAMLDPSGHDAVKSCQERIDIVQHWSVATKKVLSCSWLSTWAKCNRLYKSIPRHRTHWQSGVRLWHPCAPSRIFHPDPAEAHPKNPFLQPHHPLMQEPCNDTF